MYVSWTGKGCTDIKYTISGVHVLKRNKELWIDILFSLHFLATVSINLPIRRVERGRERDLKSIVEKRVDKNKNEQELEYIIIAHIQNQT